MLAALRFYEFSKFCTIKNIDHVRSYIGNFDKFQIGKKGVLSFPLNHWFDSHFSGDHQKLWSISRTWIIEVNLMLKRITALSWRGVAFETLPYAENAVNNLRMRPTEPRWRTLLQHFSVRESRYHIAYRTPTNAVSRKVLWITKFTDTKTPLFGTLVSEG